MPFRTVSAHPMYGADWPDAYKTGLGCLADFSSCSVSVGRAVVATSNTSAGCVSQGTCTVVSPTCNTVVDTYLDLSSVGKTALNLYWALVYTSFGSADLWRLGVDGIADSLIVDSGVYWEYYTGVRSFGSFNPYSSFMAYNVKQYTFTSGSSSATMYWKTYRGFYNGMFQKLQFTHCASDNVFLGTVLYTFSQETSPIAVIPLDYSEYVKYQELRKTFGYSYDGISQPGWNALDIISVLKELFPDKSWMVLDDRESTLYLWNVNFPDIPDWLLQRLSPISVKVLKSPSSLDAEKSLFTLLAHRNNVSQ